MLDMPLEVHDKTFLFHLLHVSILLMLDMPLEENKEGVKYIHYFSFNPSYAGYASGR